MDRLRSANAALQQRLDKQNGAAAVTHPQPTQQPAYRQRVSNVADGAKVQSGPTQKAAPERVAADEEDSSEDESPPEAMSKRQELRESRRRQYHSSGASSVAPSCRDEKANSLHGTKSAHSRVHSDDPIIAMLNATVIVSDSKDSTGSHGQANEIFKSSRRGDGSAADVDTPMFSSSLRDESPSNSFKSRAASFKSPSVLARLEEVENREEGLMSDLAKAMGERTSGIVV